MNRSFRAPESQMQDPFKQRQQQLGPLRSSPRVKDRDDELALFLEMRSREKERSDLLLRAAEDFDAASPLGSNQGNSPLFNVPSATTAPVRKTGADDFLNSENDKNDYDWLLTPPGTPLFPSLEMETTKTVMSQLGAPTVHPTTLKARLTNPLSEHTGRSNLVSKQKVSSPGLTSSGGGIRRPSSLGNLSEHTGRSNLVYKQPGSSPGLTSSGGGIRRPSSSGNLSELTGRSNLVSKQPAPSPELTTSSGGARRPSSSSGNQGSRSATPTGRRPTSTTVSKSSRASTPTSRTTIPSTRTMVATTKTSVSSAKPVVSATKTAVSVTKTTTVPAAKTTTPSRSSTPLSRSTARSSTPTTRPTLPAPRPTSRASTPTRRPSTPSNGPTISSPSVKTSSICNSGPVMSRQPVTSRGTSPTMKSRPWKPSEMPGFSLDAPPNLRTTLPEKPLSTRGRPGAPSPRSSSVEPASSGRPRRQSCSPSRNGISHSTGSSMPAVNRGYSKVNDNVSPVVMGTKMVERVINMRKLAPPRLDSKSSSHNLSGKSSSSTDSSGFGRSLSKKSLDMAIRHMDIRRRVPSNLRPSLMTNIPASSMYSVRSGPQRNRTVGISVSPHATSSNASSEVSVSPNGLCLDNCEIDDDIVSERSARSPSSVRGR